LTSFTFGTGFSNFWVQGEGDTYPLVSSSTLREVTFTGMTPPANPGASGFSSRDSLEMVYVPSEAYEAYVAAFRDYLPDNVVIRPIGLVGDFVIDDGVLIAYIGKDADVTVPNTVVVIKEKAFYRNSTIQSVHLPIGVISIGNESFYGCSALHTVNLPSGLQQIGDSAFRDCTSLKNITLPIGLLTVGGLALAECTSLEQIYLPAAEYQEGVLEGCTALQSITVSEATELNCQALFARNSTYRWSSSNPAAAAITSDGILTAIACGDAEITAQFADDTVILSFTVHVTESSQLNDRIIIIGKAEGVRGDTVELKASLNNLDIPAGGEFTLFYDAARFTVTTTQAGDALQGAYEIRSDAETGTIRLLFAGVNASANDRTMLTVRFRINENARFGTGTVSAANVIFYEANGEKQYGRSHNGALTVLYAATDEQLAISYDRVTLSRDYNQKQDIRVTNFTERPVHYYLQAENPYEDIFLNFVDSGSEVEPLVILPGETQTIQLSISLQNAMQEEYEISVGAYLAVGEEYVKNVTSAVKLYCHIPRYEIIFDWIETNTKTLATTYQLFNNADSFTDLTLRVSENLQDCVSFANGYENYQFFSGVSINVTLIPDLVYMKQNNIERLEGQLIATGADNELTWDIAFDLEGRTIVLEDAYRIALYEDGNPYYSIVESNSASNVTDFSDKNLDAIFEDDGSFKLCIDNEYTYGEGVADIRTEIHYYPYQTREIEKMVLETNPFTGEITAHLYGEIDKETDMKAISIFLNQMGDAYDIQNEIQRMIDLYETSTGGKVEMKVTVKDTTVKEVIGMGIDGFKYVIKLKDAVDAFNKIRGIFDNINDTKSIWANPEIKEDQKIAYSLLQFAKSLLAFTPDPTGGLFSSGWKTGINLLINMYSTSIGEGPLSQLSNDELGNWLLQPVKGSQCTNAHKVDTAFTLRNGLRFLFGMFEIYHRLGSGQLNGEDILGWTSSSSGGSGGSGSRCGFVVATARMYGRSDKYVETNNEAYRIYLNDTYLGNIKSDGLTEVSTFAICSDLFREGSNKIKRVFSTNPGSHQVITDTEINIFVPDDYRVAYVGDYGEFEEIRPLPDFAVYTENIYVNRDAEAPKTVFVGEEQQIRANVYNRGPRGGWVDVIVSDGSQEIYREENRYIAAFGSAAITFHWTPMREDNTLTVLLVNKTIGIEERKNDNNQAMASIFAKEREKPEITSLTEGEIQFDSMHPTAYLIADAKNCEAVVAAEFCIDGEVIETQISYTGDGSARRYITTVTADDLILGNHQLTFRLRYQSAGELYAERTSSIRFFLYDCEVSGHDLEYQSGEVCVCHYCGNTFIDIGTARVELEYESTQYDGSEKEPGIAVFRNNTELAVHDDFETEYCNNVDCGIADVIVSGVGTYVGSLTLHFVIYPEPVPECAEHTVVTDPAVSPTCSSVGYTEGSHCAVCGKVFVSQQMIPMIPHTPIVNAEIPPTCTQSGKTESSVCAVCGMILEDSETIPATGHSWSEWCVTQAPTCTEPGIETRTCIHDDAHTETREIAAKGHTPDAAKTENQSEPTCTQDGCDDLVVCCLECGIELLRNSVSIPALGHTPGEPARENEVAPTYTEEGHYDEVVYCTRCGLELERHTHDISRLPVEAAIEWNKDDVKFKGKTAYVIANGKPQTPRFTVKNKADGSVIPAKNYDFEYRENTKAGTGYVFLTFKEDYTGTCRGTFKIYLQQTATTTVANIKDGIKLTWSKVTGADGYVIYRRAWSSTTNGWTDFVRWNNTTALNWTDTKVYAGTRYQYGIKAYFNRRLDPISNTWIGGNVGDNFNLGEVGPLKTTVRITTRTLNSVTAGKKQMTVKWSASSQFTGYQVQYATNSAFTQNMKTVKITNPKTASTVIKNLLSGKTYYVRVRSYHVFNGMTYFGGWSNTKNCKVK
jgi:hypothetical protein